jgi:hypothetical protein
LRPANHRLEFHEQIPSRDTGTAVFASDNISLDRLPVPEPATAIAGAFLLLPSRIGTRRWSSKRRTAPRLS